MRLIDADVLKEWIENWFTMNRYYHPYSRSGNIPTTELIDIIDRMPAVDSVGGVRCKDCRWYKTNYMWNGKEVKICAKEAYEPAQKADDFCSKAERRQK